MSKNIYYIHNYLGISLIIGNLMRIRVTSVECTWLGLACLLPSILPYTHGDIVSPISFTLSLH